MITEWHKPPDFAEIAETLRVPTDHIMAAMNPRSNRVTVLYTPDLSDTTIWSVTLGRDNDGVLQYATPPCPHEGMWEEIVKNIESKLEERFDRP